MYIHQISNTMVVCSDAPKIYLLRQTTPTVTIRTPMTSAIPNTIAIRTPVHEHKNKQPVRHNVISMLL